MLIQVCDEPHRLQDMGNSAQQSDGALGSHWPMRETDLLIYRSSASRRASHLTLLSSFHTLNTLLQDILLLGQRHRASVIESFKQAFGFPGKNTEIPTNQWRRTPASNGVHHATQDLHISRGRHCYNTARGIVDPVKPALKIETMMTSHAFRQLTQPPRPE
jgi:hypothetical protein